MLMTVLRNCLLTPPKRRSLRIVGRLSAQCPDLLESRSLLSATNPVAAHVHTDVQPHKAAPPADFAKTWKVYLDGTNAHIFDVPVTQDNKKVSGDFIVGATHVPFKGKVKGDEMLLHGHLKTSAQTATILLDVTESNSINFTGTVAVTLNGQHVNGTVYGHP